MRNTTTIALREFKSYLASPMAYVVTGIFLAATGFFFSGSAATYSETSITGFLLPGSIMLLLFAPLLTMRLLAEERKMGTLELLLTAPVRDSEVIMGKFLGSVGMLTAMLVLTFYYPLLLMWFGDPDMGPIATGYLGLFLLGGASLAVGLFASSLTSNQIVAAVVAIGILFALWFLATAFFHVLDFRRGIVDTRSVVYYLSITALFLFLAIRSLESSRWS